jgi:hypothetical protein
MVVGYLVLIEVGKLIFYRLAGAIPGRDVFTTTFARCVAEPPASPSAALSARTIRSHPSYRRTARHAPIQETAHDRIQQR